MRYYVLGGEQVLEDMGFWVMISIDKNYWWVGKKEMSDREERERGFQEWIFEIDCKNSQELQLPTKVKCLGIHDAHACNCEQS